MTYLKTNAFFAKTKNEDKELICSVVMHGSESLALVKKDINILRVLNSE